MAFGELPSRFFVGARSRRKRAFAFVAMQNRCALCFRIVASSCSLIAGMKWPFWQIGNQTASYPAAEKIVN
jgi:hypothetical protein